MIYPVINNPPIVPKNLDTISKFSYHSLDPEMDASKRPKLDLVRYMVSHTNSRGPNYFVTFTLKVTKPVSHTSNQG